jgi:hypothetical protein
MESTRCERGNSETLETETLLETVSSDVPVSNHRRANEELTGSLRRLKALVLLCEERVEFAYQCGEFTLVLLNLYALYQRCHVFFFFGAHSCASAGTGTLKEV